MLSIQTFSFLNPSLLNQEMWKPTSLVQKYVKGSGRDSESIPSQVPLSRNMLRPAPCRGEEESWLWFPDSQSMQDYLGGMFWPLWPPGQQNEHVMPRHFSKVELFCVTYTSQNQKLLVTRALLMYEVNCIVFKWVKFWVFQFDGAEPRPFTWNVAVHCSDLKKRTCAPQGVFEVDYMFMHAWMPSPRKLLFLIRFCSMYLTQELGTTLAMDNLGANQCLKYSCVVSHKKSKDKVQVWRLSFWTKSQEVFERLAKLSRKLCSQRDYTVW